MTTAVTENGPTVAGDQSLEFAADKMLRSAREHGDRFLLPRRWRYGKGDTAKDALYDAAELLVSRGIAEWLPRNSTFWPGIRLTGKPFP